MGLAHYIAHGLDEAGHEVFIDTRMHLGTDWPAELTNRIEWCDYFVLLITKEILTSEMVKEEVRLAFERNKRHDSPRILPVRVRYTGRLDYELNARLAKIQTSNWEADTDSDRLLSEILAVASASSNGLIGSGNWSDGEADAEGDVVHEVRRPKPSVDPRAFSAPGGTIKPTDPFYLSRGADALITQRASNVGETLVIKAPRQLGKSSLLLHYLAECHGRGKRFAMLDFSLFADTQIENYGTLLSGIAAFLVRALNVADVPPPQVSNQQQLTHFIEDTILRAIPDPVVISFDEVDRVYGTSYQGDFFTMLRMWHNKRAELFSPWERVDLALVISTEPYLLINTPDRSPFNVSEPVRLSPFGLEECVRLNGLYGEPLNLPEVRQLYDLLGGHPFLTRLALYRLISPDPITASDMHDAAAEVDGPFGDHLRALLLKLNKQPNLLDGLRQVIHNGTADEDIYFRLYSCGLVQRRGGRLHVSNDLYRRFFTNVLTR